MNLVLDCNGDKIVVGSLIIPNRPGTPYEVLAIHNDCALWCVSTGSGQYDTFHSSRVTVIHRNLLEKKANI